MCGTNEGSVLSGGLKWWERRKQRPISIVCRLSGHVVWMPTEIQSDEHFVFYTSTLFLMRIRKLIEIMVFKILYTL